jgi:hypothetical protein
MMRRGRLSTGKQLITGGMLQDVLALLNRPIGEAGKGHRKNSSFKDQSQPRLDRRRSSTVSHRLGHRLSYMERNQGFGHESAIGQESEETQFLPLERQRAILEKAGPLGLLETRSTRHQQSNIFQPGRALDSEAINPAVSGGDHPR